MGGSVGTLVERLEARRPEIEQTILARVYSVSDPTEAGDPEYVTGLRAAVTAAVSYGLSGLQEVGEPSTPVPPALLAQARHAARNGVSLDTVLRRYFAGYTLLGDFVMQQAEKSGTVGEGAIHRLSRAQAALFDRLVVAVTDEYRHEAEGHLRGADNIRTERVRRLLAGEALYAAGLNYELDAWHLGLIAVGPGSSQALRRLATGCDRHLLSVCPNQETAWAWLGGRGKLGAKDALGLASQDWPGEAILAIGEPAQGLSGWRLTHRQAAAALPVAIRSAQPLVRYADVSLLASMLQDDVLMLSLRDLYLAPLAFESDGGETLRQTLRAYFAAERNASSAAAALGIDRRTVASRLNLVEARLGRPLGTCAAEVDAALRLEDMAGEMVGQGVTYRER